jgi:hypothetical protein
LTAASDAQSTFFFPHAICTIIKSMTLLQRLIQMVTDWIGGIPMDILGDRAEEAVDEWRKKRRLRREKQSDGNEQREQPSENTNE